MLATNNTTECYYCDGLAGPLPFKAEEEEDPFEEEEDDGLDTWGDEQDDEDIEDDY